jgi:predicted ATPase
LQPRVNDAEVFQFGPFRLIASERLLVNKGEPVVLGGRAFDILVALLERAGEVVSHGELIKRVWPDVVVEESSLRVHIAGLRRVIGDGRDGVRYVTNIPARGYCFVAPVQRLSQRLVERVKLRSIPARLQRMIGRDGTVETLRAAITSKRFVSIVGPGGVGKTTVAVAVAHEKAADFGGAIFFVDLSALRDDALVVSAVASAAGCLSQAQDSLTRLLAFLADKRVLLVLDNCEHVIESVAKLAEGLFRAAPLVHILTTTREALRVEGENIYLLESLDSPSSEVTSTAAKVLVSPAARLFMDRAAAGGYRRELTDEEAPVVASICRQLGGLPLAIELTASRASAYGIGGLAQQIGDRLMLLWQGRRSVPRHRTLRAMLDWSYDLLSEREQAILCALSVFVGAFTLEMARAVAFELDRDDLQVEGVVTSLVEKSLISVSQTDHASSYRLLDTTQAYAAAKLKERGETDAIARRHACYLTGHLAGVRANVSMDRDVTTYAREIGDIRAALEWSFSPSGDSSVGVVLAADAVPLFLRMSMPSECRQWSLEAIRALTDEDRGTKLELPLQLSLAISSTYVHGTSEEAGTVWNAGSLLPHRWKTPSTSWNCWPASIFVVLD